ncbi:MAG: hypothetical protein R3C56_08650 [Pirellulaceae bacterium]
MTAATLTVTVPVAVPPAPSLSVGKGVTTIEVFGRCVANHPAARLTVPPLLLAADTLVTVSVWPASSVVPGWSGPIVETHVTRHDWCTTGGEVQGRIFGAIEGVGIGDWIVVYRRYKLTVTVPVAVPPAPSLSV